MNALLYLKWLLFLSSVLYEVRDNNFLFVWIIASSLATITACDFTNMLIVGK